MKVDLFDFELPPERIALRPVRPRDAARLLVAEGAAPFADRDVRDLPQILRKGDVLVFNDTRVIPAQLEGRRGEARIGATLHKRVDLRRWQAFVRNAKRLREGDTIDFGEGVAAIAEARHDDGSFTLAFAGDEPVEVLLERAGSMPLPPYIAGKRAHRRGRPRRLPDDVRPRGRRRRRADRRAAFHASSDRSARSTRGSAAKR